MVISTNSENPIDEFNTLLNKTLNELTTEAKKKENEYKKLEGNKLEPKVYEIMVSNAKNTPFENTIELISGQKFPDIIAQKYFGVEVKTSKQDHWTTTGNSVLETTRVDGIEKIFLLFGKMYPPIEFRYRNYEDCLSEVVVTHSPRYLIDMNLKDGNTIFDKIEIPYNVLRKKSNPIKPILDYYKKQLKEGEEVWWIDQNEEKSKNLIIKFWNSLTMSQRNYYKAIGMVLFPEIFYSDFNRFALWLYDSQSIICPNIRDQFSAGGQHTITWQNTTYKNIPQILKRLSELKENIISIFNTTKSQNFYDYWEIPQIKNPREDWIDLVHQNLKKNPLGVYLKPYLKSLVFEEIKE